MHNVIVIGAGGHAKVVADIVIKNGDRLVGFLDDNIKGAVLNGYGVIGTLKDCKDFDSDTEFIVAIGNNEVRKNFSREFDLKWYTAIHPSAQIGLDCKIGEGTVVMANAVINSNSTIGKHCIINTAVVVEHDNKIGNYVHLSPSSTLCGTVQIGDDVHIGAGATVINNIFVCDSSVVGAGATVIDSITEEGIYVGVPAKKLIRM